MLRHVALSLLTLVPGRVGGSETYARALIRGLQASDLELTVLVSESVAAGAPPDADGVTVVALRGYRGGDSDRSRLRAMASAMVRPGRLRKDLPSGIQVLHYPLTVPVPRHDSPTVVTLHDLRHLELPRTSSFAERRYRAFAYDRAARRATCVVVPSEHARQTAIERLGLEPSRVTAIAHGLDHGRFAPMEEAAPPRPYLLYPANLWPHKNHHRLLEALVHVPDVELVLTGETYGRLAALEARAAELGLAERVRHLGHVADDELPGLYRRAAALVFPSLYEGFGAPPLEAMACGCPVACSTAGSLGELWSDASVTFDPEDVESIAAALDAILHNEGLRRELRERGLRRAAEFDWRRSAERHLEVYKHAHES